MIEHKIKIYDMELPVEGDFDTAELSKIRDFIEDWIRSVEEKLKDRQNINRVLVVLLAFLNAAIECNKDKERLRSMEESLQKILSKIEEIE